MTRLNVVVEGPTEVLFVNEVLSLYLQPRGVFLSARAVFTSNRPGAIHRGGATYFSRIHQDISTWCKQDPAAKVTSMFDLYALPPDFPRYEKALKEKNPYDRVRVLEEGFAASVGCSNFIPYLQLHEFEALIFTQIERLSASYPNRASELRTLKAETDLFETPEFINDRPSFAPSKRILRAVPEYDKKLAGNVTVLDIGLGEIRNKCRHFGEWLAKLESLGAARD